MLTLSLANYSWVRDTSILINVRLQRFYIIHDMLSGFSMTIRALLRSNPRASIVIGQYFHKSELRVCKVHAFKNNPDDISQTSQISQITPAYSITPLSFCLDWLSIPLLFCVRHAIAGVRITNCTFQLQVSPLTSKTHRFGGGGECWKINSNTLKKILQANTSMFQQRQKISF